jgi:hypothetical protein
MSTVLDILLFLWQLPQHLIAAVYYTFWTVRRKIVMVEGQENVFIYYVEGHKGGVTLGKYIFVPCNAGYRIVKHEIGHSKQSVILGPVYLLVIGLPSLIWALTYDKIFHSNNYFSFYTEHWANVLGKVAF